MLSAHCLSVCNVGVLWPNGWMDQDDTWHGGRPRPGPHCVRWEPSFPSPKGHSPPPTFRRMSIVAKRSLISATVEHLFNNSACSLVRTTHCTVDTCACHVADFSSLIGFSYLFSSLLTYILLVLVYSLESSSFRYHYFS